jgi:hypothetical protein
MAYVCFYLGNNNRKQNGTAGGTPELVASSKQAQTGILRGSDATTGAVNNSCSQQFKHCLSELTTWKEHLYVHTSISEDNWYFYLRVGDT